MVVGDGSVVVGGMVLGLHSGGAKSTLTQYPWNSLKNRPIGQSYTISMNPSLPILLMQNAKPLQPGKATRPCLTQSGPVVVGTGVVVVPTDKIKFWLTHLPYGRGEQKISIWVKALRNMVEGIWNLSCRWLQLQKVEGCKEV